MSRFIADFISVPEPELNRYIEQLEIVCGRRSHDIRLMLDIQNSTRHKLAELNLDPTDTNTEELYETLQLLAADHDKNLLKLMKAENADAQTVLKNVLATVKKLNIVPHVWALKTSTAKRLIKQAVPEQLTKVLGYRSIDSMLKREPIGILWALLPCVESTNWYEQFVQSCRTAGPSDFEERTIEYIVLDSPRWQKLCQKLSGAIQASMLNAPEVGAIVTLPVTGPARPGFALLLFVSIIEQINELRRRGALTKLHQVKPNFGQLFADSIRTRGTEPIAYMTPSAPLTWSTIHHYFAIENCKFYPEVFEPHLLPNDLALCSPADMLTSLEPSLHFWQATDWLAVVDQKGPVSLNLLDAALNYYNQAHFPDRARHHSQRSIWQQLELRYFAEPALQDEVLKQLGSENMMTEFTSPSIVATKLSPYE